MKKIATAILLLWSFYAFAQQPQLSDEKAQKTLREALDKEIDRLTNLLNLESWQVFYVDSIFTHDYTSRYIEIEELSKKKVSTTEAYTQASDKWVEASYQALKKILTQEQWLRYEKSGAGKEKRARDKRAQKMNK